MRAVLVKAAGKKVKLMWSVYARSVPDTKKNALAVYFPGAKQVDLVGADAYNFGNAQGLTWTAPADLFAPAYGTIQKLAQEAVLDLRDGLDRPRRRRGRLDRRARPAGQDHAEARRGRLVRRQGQHRRLPRAAQRRSRGRLQGVRPWRLQVARHPQP